MDYFQDKVAIVTGGASGIGRALCRELGRRGAQVTVADLNEKGAEETAAEIGKAGGRARGVRLDVTRAEEVKRLIETTAAEKGRLDFMFNNAGIDIGGELQDLTLEHWRRVIEINQWGVIHGIVHAYPLMLKQGRGHIVNTASLAGLIPLPMETIYAASKFAVYGLSMSLRSEAGIRGIRVSVVCPDFVSSRFFDSSEHVNYDKEGLLGLIPSFVYTTPESCARAVLRGVKRNRSVITVGALGKLLWGIYRRVPRLFILGQRLYARMIKRKRKEKGGPVS